jgi:hypothetical protein
MAARLENKSNLSYLRWILVHVVTAQFASRVLETLYQHLFQCVLHFVGQLVQPVLEFRHATNEKSNWQIK